MRTSLVLVDFTCPEKLRRGRLAATVLTVCLTTNEFKEGPQYSNALTLHLPVVTDNTSELIRCALQGIRTIYRDGATSTRRRE